jgi:hypothetical protein
MNDSAQPGDRPDVLTTGAERRPPGRWRRYAAAALLAGLAVGGAGVAIAATDTPTPEPTPSPESQAPRLERKGFGFPGHFKGAFGALHGEFVVPKADGGYQTLAIQRGEVTGKSETEITVRSEDGYSRTYAVPGETSVNGGRNGFASVSTGDQVHIVATVDRGQYTAIRVVDFADVRRPFERFRPHRLAPEDSTTTPTPS